MNIIISNSSNEPIYKQISNQIKEMILSKDLDEGEALPSIRKMAKDLRVSVITTKRAYEVLEEEGFVDTVQGKGCYVSSQNKELLKEIRLKSFEDLLLQVISESKTLKLNLTEVIEILKELSKEE